MTTTRRRFFAAAGVLGPAVFVGFWALLGATRPGYSPIDDAISELARIGTSTRPAMTFAFLVYAFALGLFALEPGVPRTVRISLAATGAATVGVAGFPLGGVSDEAHAVFAGIGYATLAAAPLFAGRELPAGPWRAWSYAAGTACALLLLASVVGPTHGLFQRAGLTMGDAWIVTAAVRSWRAQPANSRDSAAPTSR